MLVTLKEILAPHQGKNFAVGAFNVPGSAYVRGVIRAAEENGVPVILMHAPVHDCFMPIELAAPLMLAAAKAAAVPVCVHLDHGETVCQVQKALQLGFTSVMYDGSNLPYEENLKNTRRAVELAKGFGASVEGEIGSMGSRETGAGESGALEDKRRYTDPKEACLFVKETGIDALACSFGTTHGLYISPPRLDFSVLKEISRAVKIPLVMHGGSGVSREGFRQAIENGVTKINYYTYMSLAAGKAAKKLALESNGRPLYFHDIEAGAAEAVKEDAGAAMRVFAGI